MRALTQILITRVIIVTKIITIHKTIKFINKFRIWGLKGITLSLRQCLKRNICTEGPRHRVKEIHRELNLKTLIWNSKSWDMSNSGRIQSLNKYHWKWTLKKILKGRDCSKVRLSLLDIKNIRHSKKRLFISNTGSLRIYIRMSS